MRPVHYKDLSNQPLDTCSLVVVGCCVFLRDAGVWARFVITSVALIYTARLSVYALSHTLERPHEYSAFNMPKWWDTYRIIGGHNVYVWRWRV